MNDFQRPEDERLDFFEEPVSSLDFEDAEDDHPDERWLVSYADMMTLLFGLFVLLFSMSVMDQDKAKSILKSTEEHFGITDSGATQKGEAKSDTQQDKTSLGDMDLQIATLRGDIDALKTELQKVKQERDDLIIENDGLLSKKDAPAVSDMDKKELLHLKKSLKLALARQKDLEAQLDQASQAPAVDPSDELKDQVKDLEKQLASASVTQNKMNKLKSYLLKLRDSRRDLLARNQLLTKRNQGLQRDFQGLQAQLTQADELRSQMGAMQRKLASAQGLSAQVAQLKAAHQAAQTDRLRVSEQLEKAMIDKEAAQKKLSESQRKVASLEQDLQKNSSSLKKAQEQMEGLRNSKSFLAFMIDWSSKDHDIDLTIEDPQGKVYTYKNRTIPGQPGKFVVDTKRGPGVEFWQSSKLIPGRYKATYYFFNQYGNVSPAKVSATILSPKGSFDIAPVKMDLTTSRKHVVVFDVSTSGGVNIVSGGKSQP
jgi:uncharacterized protein YfaP (DUF2135 family)